jgi:tRNA dimethylallyltransferase
MKEERSKPKAIVLCGPTGIGKTATAISISQRMSCQVIGADSMQIYRYMDIGTAKPTIEEKALVPHHMIDIIDPDEPFDAESYASCARPIAFDLYGKNIVPLVVGGTGLYLKALLCGLFSINEGDVGIRNRLRAEADCCGVEPLYKKLKTIDPEASKKIHPNDAFRIIRALEVFETTGRPISFHQQKHRFKNKYFVTLKIGLTTDRDRLYERINRRVLAMMNEGFLNEVKRLLERGYSPKLKSMQSIGYKQLIDHLGGKQSLSESISLIQRETRRYAKRQLTWFRSDKEIVWMDPEQFSEILTMTKQFLRN